MPRVSHPLALPEAETRQLVRVKKGNEEYHAYVLERRIGKVYVHYANTDRRLDDWVPEKYTEVLEDQSQIIEEPPLARRSQKRKRSPLELNGVTDGDTFDYALDPFEQGGAGNISEEEDIAEHQMLTSRRNFDLVNFGEWQMKTWYFSPYPVTETEAEEQSNSVHNGQARPTAPSRTVSTNVAAAAMPNAIPESPIDVALNGRARKPVGKGLHRTSIRSHGRTADMLAGGLNRDSAREKGETNVLWVCDRCFKYMNEGLPYEMHTKTCQMKHPPGRVVYQNGAYHIYEVDGAEQKLYCQNLSLFGKLFIDIKTLFFDCENFLFYILTDAKPSRDFVIGFFSKEKVSYDDYNLACIVVLPPHQRKGHGLSLIEFSYVLSQRSGKVGSPERPLSDLGLRSYLSYWVAAIIRFFRTVVRVLPLEISETPLTDGSESSRNRKRTSMALMHDDEAVRFGVRRTHHSANLDGSVTTHANVECTLDEISKATAIKPEDVAFALRECGLIRPSHLTRSSGDSDDGSNNVIVISREMVEKIARKRNIRPNIIQPALLKF